LKKFLLLHIIFFIASSIAFSQNCTFSGIIQDAKGSPIPYSSIYIAKLATGKMANMEGKYEMNLPCGNYQIKVQCLGFETKLLNIDASSANSKKTIVLKAKSFTFGEVTVNASAEDPAYNIMRKAIVMAEYYKKQIKEYNCNIYVRSFWMVDQIPGIAKMLAKPEDLEDMKAGDISETVLEYSYKYPNKVKEKIISTRNGTGDTSKTSSDYINLNFYNIGGSQIISPLSRNAFQVYKFELMSSYNEDGITVNKIKIIPKRKGNDLMSGHLYINDQKWNINSVDVNYKQQLIDVEYKQLYVEVTKNAWMPISHEIKVKAALMGFKGHWKYIASISKIKVKTDKTVDDKIKSLVDMPLTGDAPIEQEEITPINKTPNAKLSGTEKKINDLMGKEKLTRGETMKLVRLVNKESKEEKKESGEKTELELTRDHHTEYADSAFSTNKKTWEEIRETPLSEEETTIYNQRDSLTRVQNGDTVINKKRSVIGNILFFNGTIKSKNKNSKLKIPGLFSKLSLNFNTVDGFVIRKKLFSYQRKYTKGRYYFFEPSILYAFEREEVMGKIDFNTMYNSSKRAGFYLSGGRITADFNTNQPMPNFFNSVSTLFFEENYKKLYQKDYALLGHTFDIKNGLSLNTSVEYADRTRLFNTSDFKVIDSKDVAYTINTPFNSSSDFTTGIFSDNKAFNISAKVSYTPKYFYRYKNDRKQMLYSKYPTLDITYKQGIKDVLESKGEYSFIEAGIHQSTRVDLIDKMSYYIGGGGFITNQSVYFADYKSFYTQPFYVIGESKLNSFKLLDFYKLSTNEYYLEGHFSIEDNVLLFKRLPLLNRTNLSEELYFNYLYTNLETHYYEVGYSLNKLFLMFDVEVFASFVNDTYSAFGVKLKLNFINNSTFNE
jgi:Family of unknown function (DUF5686)/CarboxypepD_reg-like domain